MRSNLALERTRAASSDMDARAAQRGPPPGMREARSWSENSVRTELAQENLRAIQSGLDRFLRIR